PADRHSPGEAAQAEMADLHPQRSQGGDETEEDEDEDLAEAHIPIGPLPSGVEPRGGHGGCADDEEPPRLRDEDENDAGETDAAEDEDLGEARLPIGPVPTGVEPGGGDGGCADGEEPPRLRDEGGHDAGETGKTEEEEGRTLDRMRLGQTGRGQTHRTDSL